MRASGPGESAKLLVDVVDVLTARSIDYAVIGALAASLHGAGRASLDANLVVSSSIMEGTRIDEALKRAGLTTELRRGDLEDAIPGLVRVSDSFGNQVDVLLGIRGLDPEAFSRTVEVPLEGTVELLRSLGLRSGTGASASLERMLRDLGFGRQASQQTGYGVDDDFE